MRRNGIGTGRNYGGVRQDRARQNARLAENGRDTVHQRIVRIHQHGRVDRERAQIIVCRLRRIPLGAIIVAEVKKSLRIELIERQRESKLVTHLVEDSVFSKVFVTKQERQDYYERHRTGFVTYPMVRYALIVRNDKAGADSVKARLDAHVSAEVVVHEDSTRGEVRSGIMELRQNEQNDYKKLLFEELRPGASIVLGPDKKKAFAVMHLISFDPGHLLPFKEVESMIDESVRNEKSEKALKEFLARLTKRFPVESHPELVMKIRAVDPSGDEQ